jgi:hypothetical protein
VLDSLEDVLKIARRSDAQALAAPLFKEAFNAEFPVPRDNCGLSFPTPPANWSQYVATYTWPDGSEEAVGFCNFIRYKDVYLEGGMCVKAGFYRRLPKSHWEACRSQGGIAQMMMQTAANELNTASPGSGFVAIGEL